MIKKNKFMFLGVMGGLMLAVTFAVASVSADTTFTQITGSTTLKLGSKNENVTSLQHFLASNSSIYPAGTVTGYFGPMTKAAVVQFQLSYNLTADGIAGNATKNKVNSIIEAGKGIDLSAPAINNLSVVPSGKNVTITFSSNELVKATVFYDTNSINWNNWSDSVASLEIPTISGTQNTDSTFGLTKQFTLSNLSANSNYNYTITATDQSGNVSVIWPTTFKTGQ